MNDFWIKNSRNGSAWLLSLQCVLNGDSVEYAYEQNEWLFLCAQFINRMHVERYENAAISMSLVNQKAATSIAISKPIEMF